jgi:hypothetical protein
MAPVDLPLSHGDNKAITDTESYRDVLAESVSTSFSTEETPAPKAVVVPPRAVSVSKARADAAPPEEPEPTVPVAVEPHQVERELERATTERPMERASFSTWGTPPPEPDRRSLVIPLSFAMLLGLAGGFGLGYWTGWRSALRESSASAASAAPERREAPPASVASPPARSAPSETAGRTPPASAASPRANEASAPARSAAAPASAASPSRREAAPPPRETRASTGKLLVKSTPSGAQVRVDGRVRGKTPLVLRELPLKVMRVTIEHGGFHAEEQRVALSAAKPTVTVDAKLTPLAPPAPVARTGSLVIESRPAGARAFIDGRDLGTTPVSLPDVAPGPHRVRIELAGFTPWVTMAEIKAGVRSRVAASLEQGQAQ